MGGAEATEPGANSAASDGNGNDNNLPPETHANPTLVAALQRIAKEQAEDAEIIADMAPQGPTKPTNSSKFRDWLVLQEEPVMLCGMLEGQPYVQPIHSVAQYATANRHRDSYNGEYLGAIGDRDDEEDPGFVCLKKSLFEWQNVTLVDSTDDISEIATWFDGAENTEKYFNTSNAVMATEAVAIPKLAMIPAEIGLAIVSERCTPGSRP
mmetsp:Transcript_28403/g.59963  ORF Transcript_28403/g.59963 Transcript_28403/m.59963 type:complete len:210 (+) Transcript_28403:171-800(+)